MKLSIADTKSKIIIAFIFSSLVGILFSIQQYFWSYSFDKEFVLVRDLYYQFSYAYTWGIIFFLLTPFANKYRFEKNDWFINFIRHLFYGIFISLLHRVIFIAPYYYFFSPQYMSDGITKGVLYKMIGGSFDGFVVYWLIVGAYYGADYYIQFRKHQLKANKLETQLAQAQLNALKMQLQPHFLFNTMHAISTLMDVDVKVARNMIVKLSNLLRQTLDNIGVEEVSLNQELEILDTYLEIEKTRFQERLQINYNIDPKTKNASVPNLILQPLVENAIKHGIAPHANGGKIDIISESRNHNLFLSVCDNGKGDNGNNTKEGIGLSNTRERLTQLYGEKYSMNIASEINKGYCVEIIIPLKEHIERKDEQE